MKLLITGGSGFVGRNLVRFFAARHSVTFTYLQSVGPTDLSHMATRLQMDIQDEDAVTAVFEKARPDAVIHLAGNKNVKYCEENPERASRINAQGTGLTARACRKFDARMVYLSTDLVFQCTSGGYKETETPVPGSVYGRTKLAGEHAASMEVQDLAICRSGGIYGPDSPLLRWVTEELMARRQVPCLTNVRNTPTYVESLCEMIEAVLKKNLTGVFHTVGSEIVNRFEFFQGFANAFDLDARHLQPIESEELMKQMMLSPNASLNSTWTDGILGIKGISIQEGMTRFKSTTTGAVQAEGS